MTQPDFIQPGVALVIALNLGTIYAVIQCILSECEWRKRERGQMSPEWTDNLRFRRLW